MQRVLVVDPDPRTVRLFEQALSGLSVQVVWATGSLEAWQQIGNGRPTVVISEQSLSDGTEGLPFLRALKRIYPPVRCVLFTATPANPSLEELGKAPSSELTVLWKPCDPKVLRTLIGSLLDWIA